MSNKKTEAGNTSDFMFVCWEGGVYCTPEYTAEMSNLGFPALRIGKWTYG